MRSVRKIKWGFSTEIFDAEIYQFGEMRTAMSELRHHGSQHVMRVR